MDKRIILIVDDEPEIVTILGEFLRKNGYGVIECVTGKNALGIINGDKPFDLVILDLKMPGIDGIKIMNVMKRLGKRVPVILITGSIDEEIKELGADALFLKPIDLNDLLAKIKEMLPALPGRHRSF